jgi:hypothetical protein
MGIFFPICFDWLGTTYDKISVNFFVILTKVNGHIIWEATKKDIE